MKKSAPAPAPAPAPAAVAHVPEVSIVVPVYRVEKVVDQCVRSIVRQSFRDWELILVDDRSPAPDRSSEKIAAWPRRDPRIRVITHDRNRGVSQARFTGLGAARGRYVVFVDPDDWIPRTAIGALHERIERDGADMVIGSTVKVVGSHGFVRSKPRNAATLPNRSDTIAMPELLDDYFVNYFGVYIFPVLVWGRIYRRAAIERARMKPVPYIFCEDLTFNMELHPFLEKIAFIPDTVYYYRHGGMSNTSTPQLLDTAKIVHRNREELIRRYDYRKALLPAKHELTEFFYTHFRNRMMLDGLSRQDVEREVRDELRDPLWGGSLFDGLPPTARIDALRARDIDTVTQIITTEARRLTPRHRLVKAVSRLLV